MLNVFLYIATVIIWGASWIGIGFQIAEAPPVQAVLYRYIAGALLTLGALTLLRRRRPMSRSQHVVAAGMGFAMFGMNYVLVYTAVEIGLPTGLAAVATLAASTVQAQTISLSPGAVAPGGLVTATITNTFTRMWIPSASNPADVRASGLRAPVLIGPRRSCHRAGSPVPTRSVRFPRAAIARGPAARYPAIGK